MRPRLGLSVLFPLALVACSGSTAPPPVTRGLGPPPSGATAPAATMPDADLLVAIDERPTDALARLAGSDRADAPIAMRIAHALASWASTQPDETFTTYLRAHGVDASQDDAAAALLAITTRALDADAIGVAGATYGAWLAPQPEGPPLSTEGRAVAVRLHDALMEHEAGDLAESLTTAVLRRDPEHAELARAQVGGLLGDQIVVFLRAHSTASWASAIARDLPSHATLFDLENAQTFEQMATAMTELGGVSPEAARTQLVAARDSLHASLAESE